MGRAPQALDNGSFSIPPLPTKGAPMKQEPIKMSDLAQRIEQLEMQQADLLDTLKFLLPIAISIPASTSTSAEAIKELRAALRALEGTRPRSEDFWHLASAMAVLLSSKAAAQHPDDSEVLAIHSGVRSHRMQ